MTDKIPTRLFAALFAAQKEVEPVPKASDFDAGGKFGYKYASGPDVVRYARKALHKHGLAVVLTSTTTRQASGDGESHRGVVAMSGFLMHDSGETLPVVFELPYVGSKGRPDDKASQASITTGEARAYRLLLALTTSDEEAEVANFLPDEHVAPRSAPETSRPKPTAPPVASAPPAAAPPDQAAVAEARAEREAIQAVEQQEQASAEAVEAGDPAETFKEVAARLGLDVESAVAWASRKPLLIEGARSKLKDSPKPAIKNFAEASERGLLAKLAAVLKDDIAELKEREIHPRKSGWSERVNKWAADQLGF